MEQTRAKNDADWHKQVCERANYVCVGCTKDFSFDHYFDIKGVNQYVCGHHKLRKGSHPHLRLIVENGACVCSDCHTKIHALGEIEFEIAIQAVLSGNAERASSKEDELQSQKTKKGTVLAKRSASKKRPKFEKIWGVTKPPRKIEKKEGKQKKPKNQKVEVNLQYNWRTGKNEKI